MPSTAAIPEPTLNNDSNPLLLEIVTPEGRTYAGGTKLVELPTVTGELGIYPGHVPVFAELGAGEIRAYVDNRIDAFSVAGGYVRIGPKSIRVLAYFASPGEEEAKIEEACRRAKVALETTGGLAPDKVESDLALLRMGLGKSKKAKSH